MRGIYTSAHGGGRLTQSRFREFLILDARHLHVDVDAVQQRAGDAFLVFAHHHVRACARFDRVAVISTWTGVERLIISLYIYVDKPDRSLNALDYDKYAYSKQIS